MVSRRTPATRKYDAQIRHTPWCSWNQTSEVFEGDEDIDNESERPLQMGWSGRLCHVRS